jgi:hypothetical protein
MMMYVVMNDQRQVSLFLFAGAMDSTGADAEIQFIENR